MKVVLRPTFAGRKTVKTETKRKRWHSPEQMVLKIEQADRILVVDRDVAAILKGPDVMEVACYRRRKD